MKASTPGVLLFEAVVQWSIGFIDQIEHVALFLDGKCSGWKVSQWLLIVHAKKSSTRQHESHSHAGFLLCMYVCESKARLGINNG